MERFLVSPMEEVDRGVEIGDEVVGFFHHYLLFKFLSLPTSSHDVPGRWV